MKVAIFGLGSIGKRHAKILRACFRHDLIAYRSGHSNGFHAFPINEVRDWKELDKVQPEVALITNPTARHAETALECASRGMHLFIEKPLDSRLNHFKKLLQLVSKKKITTYVAYVLRFHPILQKLKTYLNDAAFLHMRVIVNSYLPSWRPGTDHLKSYSAKNDMGGGVIFDLSHELDYTQFLLGKITKLQGQSSRRSNVTVDAEDFADILVDAERGPANIHINFLSHIRQREIQIDFKEKSVVGDLVRQSITEYKRGKLVKTHVFKTNMDECYRKQLEYFFSNIQNTRMMNNIFEAAELFKKIYRFRSEVLHRE